jgi:hypothetical protein
MSDDRLIAIVAVMVSGVVGVAGPFIAWRATVGSTHDARVLADRTELRSVLDQSTADVRSLQDRTAAAFTLWIPDGERPRSAAGRRSFLAAVADTQHVVGVVQQDLARLRIRLGNSASTSGYLLSLTHLGAALDWMSDHGYPGSDAKEINQASRYMKAAEKPEDQFEESAFRLGGSVLQ